MNINITKGKRFLLVKLSQKVYQNVLSLEITQTAKRAKVKVISQSDLKGGRFEIDIC